MKYRILFIVGLYVINFANAQVQDFYIIHRGDTVGLVYTEQKTPDILHTQYSIKSDVDVMFIIHLQIYTTMNVRFENGSLSSSDVVQKSNRGVFDGDVKTKWIKDKYTVLKNGRSFYLNEKSIKWTVSKLYFEEPTGINKIYSEEIGKFVELEKNSKNCYKLKVNYPTSYCYENGKLQNVKVESIVGDILFVRKNR